jgi:hypothetical protein
VSYGRVVDSYNVFNFGAADHEHLFEAIFEGDISRGTALAGALKAKLDYMLRRDIDKLNSTAVQPKNGLHLSKQSSNGFPELSHLSLTISKRHLTGYTPEYEAGRAVVYSRTLAGAGTAYRGPGAFLASSPTTSCSSAAYFTELADVLSGSSSG